MRRFRKLNMTVHGTFTIGLPGETPEQMRETLEFVRSIPLNSHQLSGTAEIEGTPFHAFGRTGSSRNMRPLRWTSTTHRSPTAGKNWLLFRSNCKIIKRMWHFHHSIVQSFRGSTIFVAALEDAPRSSSVAMNRMAFERRKHGRELAFSTS